MPFLLLKDDSASDRHLANVEALIWKVWDYRQATAVFQIPPSDLIVKTFLLVDFVSDSMPLTQSYTMCTIELLEKALLKPSQ